MSKSELKITSCIVRFMYSKRMRDFATVSVCVAASVIAACATKPEIAKSVNYQCDDGTEFSVSFTEKGFTTMRGGRNSMHRYEIRKVAANITLADGTLVTLPAQKVASGFMYSDGRYSFRGKNNEAKWVVGKMAAEHCIVNQ